MTCQELTNDVLLDYADWQLAPADRNRISHHLEGCEPCRVRRDDLEGIAGAARRAAGAPPAPLMAQLDRSVLGSLRAASPPPAAVPLPRLMARWPIALATIAALALVAVVSYLAGARSATEPSTGIAVRPVPSPSPDVPPPKETPRTPDRGRPAAASLPRAGPPPPPPRPEPSENLRPPQPPSPPALRTNPEKPPPPHPPARLRGDLNGDGVVDIADARILQQMIEQGVPLPDYADVNGDGVVDIADVLAILRAELALR